ncbi:MAG: prepilin-type N-terminal cleavage/methylation domain-containing protein [Candidatus Beckwithbacteria bacterium]
MKNKGFTFIEMLVVITIIAVLTMIGVTSFGVANRKARDGKRKGDLEQIRAALEIYYTDESDYPPSLTFGTGTITNGSDTYMNPVPNDPLSTQTYVYTSVALSKSYDLYALLEGEAGTAYTSDCGPSTCNYKVSNPL